nr:hypothetical protein [Halorubrum halodurans]
MREFVATDPALAAVVVALWIALALYGLSAVWWILEATVLARGGRVDPEEVAWGYEDVQVRILTIDAEPVVQANVNAVPDGLDDVRVIAEAPIDVDGAAVHVVPEEFECVATNKGRAVEWARRNVPCEREYVLYLDEDTIMAGFEGLPDADVVQFTEKPLYTGSRIAYLSEIFRVGYQYEQFAFHRLRYPLYAWGGGVAVRRSLEQSITWDAATITEDTNFIWRAADEVGVSFAVLDVRFRNQAPRRCGRWPSSAAGGSRARARTAGCSRSGTAPSTTPESSRGRSPRWSRFSCSPPPSSPARRRGWSGTGRRRSRCSGSSSSTRSSARRRTTNTRSRGRCISS